MLDLTKEMLEKFDIKINSGLTEEEKEKIGKLTKKIQELQKYGTGGLIPKEDHEEMIEQYKSKTR